MKILYGVQGTGNGHITRALAITKAMAAADEPPEVDLLFSGRPPETIEIDARTVNWRRGMTFATADGKVLLGRTILENNLPRLVADIRQLDLSTYDLIVTDFEPVVAWAARLRGRPVIGIGHQYAFNFGIPVRGGNLVNRSVLKWFAPAKASVGLHWHHFGFPILPPIVNVDSHIVRQVQANKVTVYLAFENLDHVVSLLKNMPDYEFYVYHPNVPRSDEGNIHVRPTSRVTFEADLLSSDAVICNTGFELISECLALGIRILTKPVAGQVEQLSNGAALSDLGYATVTDHLFLSSMKNWLATSSAVSVSYPEVHECLAAWIVNGASAPVEQLADKMWQNVKVCRHD